MVCSDDESLITDQLTGLTRQKLIVVKLHHEGAVLLVSSTLTSQFIHGVSLLHSPSVPVGENMLIHPKGPRLNGELGGTLAWEYRPPTRKESEN